MSNFKKYYIADVYLISFHVLLSIFAIQWQSNAPYETAHKTMAIAFDLFICIIFAMTSACITYVGLHRCMTKSSNYSLYIGKFILGSIYGVLCTITAVTIADINVFHHENFIRGIFIAILFSLTVYFSILQYADLRSKDYWIIFTILAIVFLFFLYLYLLTV